jgi:DNA polymerase III alpha subunit
VLGVGNNVDSVLQAHHDEPQNENNADPKSRSDRLPPTPYTRHPNVQGAGVENKRVGNRTGSDDLHPKPNTQTPLALRLGLLCVKGLREEAGRAIELERARYPFTSLDDLHNRVLELRKDELRKLAAVGALNFIDKGVGFRVLGVESKVDSVEARHNEPQNENNADPKSRNADPKSSSERLPPTPYTLHSNIHRRDALWQVERVSRDAGPLYKRLEDHGDSPLVPMTLSERLNADLRGTGMTIGRHPMAHQRAWLDSMNVVRAADLKNMRNGRLVRVAGWVIVRQRPGTAKGFVFLSLEDETGIANVIVTPQLFEKNRLALVDYPFLLIGGALQHQDNVVSVKAKSVEPLHITIESTGSHDFH